MILGTAGHIDHGKTSLVRALTGVDTDRLPEEKRRGITIDLGFAPLELDGVGTLGVVDVPGHEAFVRTMVAGATGIDLALLVVAADEGVMPQTREHLAILRLLGVRAGVVALTKSDLVDDEWLALVRDDVRMAVADGPLADAPLVAVSAVTGQGVEELRGALAFAASRVPGRATEDLFRMPVDRAFTIRGTGTVVTGTVWSGTLRRDATLRLFPSGDAVRVRGLQAHGHAVERIHAGERAAIALAGVELSRVGRGAVLVAGDAWRPSTVLRADVALLDDVARPVGPRSQLRLHLGTSEVGARLVATGGSLAPGEHRPARIIVDEPVVARTGDRFVLRGGSPLGTVGGGVVTDPLAPQRARAWSQRADSVADALEHFLREAALSGLDVAELPVRLGVSGSELADLLASSNAWRVEDRLYAPSTRELVIERIRTTLAEYHAAHPLDPGAPRQWLRTRVRVADAVVDTVLAELASAGELVLEQGDVRLAAFSARLSDRQRALATELVGKLTAAGPEPPTVEELAGSLGTPLSEVVSVSRLLARQGELVAVEANRYFTRSTVTELVTRVLDGMSVDGEYGPAELREFVGLSRKFLIPFLEFCDREGYTVRNDLGRRRRGTEIAR
ncbi:MAG TPA: selenocysteine-specific translation elongation factor [Gemmatimonadaceae bacterium]